MNDITIEEVLRLHEEEGKEFVIHNGEIKEAD